MFSIVIFIAIYILGRVVPSVAYSWQLNAAPVQCSDLSITVTGTDGQPPYSVLVVPYGPPPFQNKVDVRGVIQKSFNGNSNSLNVPINYPANTQFVAVVSDSGGFGTGGTSVPTLVGESGDNSCFNASQPWSPHFWFFIGPLTQAAAEVVQCNDTRVWWNHTANVVGTPSFVGVIPGGESFSILPETGITNTSTEGIGFSWLPRISQGTPLVIVGGDNRGLGAGGSAQFTIAHSDVNSCVTGGSPGSTPGTIAGAVVTQQNMAPIIGGAVGGSLGFLALCAIIAFLIIRHRKNKDRYSTGSSVYTLNSDRSNMVVKPNNSLSYYGIEPFDYPSSPTSGFGYQNTGAQMMQTTTDGMASMSSGHISIGPQQIDSPGTLSRSGSGSITFMAPHPLITTTIIQHTDGGPGEAHAENGNVPTTINLPPTYNSIESTPQAAITRQGLGGKRRTIEPNRPFSR